MLKFDDIFINPAVLEKSDTLLKVRLWFYGLTSVHLSAVSIYLLTIDFSQSTHPTIQQYESYKWKLITCWFNLFSLIYYPMCFYCDWRELKHSTNAKHVDVFNKVRYLLFSSIIWPTTMFADVLFWRLWNKDRELVAPNEVDEFVPFWTQHSMHTVTMIATILDLVIVPRKRPENIKHGILITSVFVTAYVFVCAHSLINGEYIYPIFRSFDEFKFVVVIVYTYLGHFFFYFAQWLVVDVIWGQKMNTKKLCNSVR